MIEEAAQEIAANLSRSANDFPTERERSAMMSALYDFEGLLGRAHLTLQDLIKFELNADRIAEHLVAPHQDKYASASRLRYLDIAATQFAGELLECVCDTSAFRVALARDQLETLAKIRLSHEQILGLIKNRED